LGGWFILSQAEKTKLLQINNLSKQFKEVRALDNVSLTIYENEVYGFIGKNGAGKTTTISIILALLKKDQGEIIYDGKPLEYRDVSYKKTIGFVPDVPSFPTYLNAKEFLELSAQLVGLSKEQSIKRIKETLEFVKLEHVNHKIGAYSRGMKQRLAIASALLHDPKILIMDEPTSALDPIGRKDVLDMILKLKETMTIFYSTHILEDAEKVCDRIGLIDKGKLLVEANTDELLNSIDTDRFMIALDLTDKASEEVLVQFDGFKVFTQLKQGFAFELKKSFNQHDLFTFLKDKNVSVKAFKKQTKSLEDIFMEVTHENVA